MRRPVAQWGDDRPALLLKREPVPKVRREHAIKTYNLIETIEVYMVDIIYTKSFLGASLFFL